MATQTTCGEALVTLLERYGVDTVFGIPGYTHSTSIVGLLIATCDMFLPETSRGPDSWPMVMHASVARRVFAY